MNDIERAVSFAIELDKLKAILRRSRPSGLDRYENSAEHSWHVCLLALAMAPHAKPAVDVTRVVEMLLVHDIPEIDAGDLIIYAEDREAYLDAERRAAGRIFGMLPEPQASWVRSRWEEFVARETPEAKFAYAMDRLMPVLHNLESGGVTWRENDVPLERVLAINEAIGQACPAVWADVVERIRSLFDGDGRLR